MVQESYLRAFRFFPGFHGSDARSWAFTIVRNTCFSWLQCKLPVRNTTEFDEKLILF